MDKVSSGGPRHNCDYYCICIVVGSRSDVENVITSIFSLFHQEKPLLKTCWTGMDKAEPFQPFQQRPFINIPVNMVYPYFVENTMHLLQSKMQEKMCPVDLPTPGNML